MYLTLAVNIWMEHTPSHSQKMCQNMASYPANVNESQNERKYNRNIFNESDVIISDIRECDVNDAALCCSLSRDCFASSDWSVQLLVINPRWRLPWWSMLSQTQERF